jgi:hypothetical protein
MMPSEQEGIYKKEWESNAGQRFFSRKSEGGAAGERIFATAKIRLDGIPVSRS